ncbi:YlbG family protein [Heyndrickxia acidiproducens]|uniref:YlbG family protein n=1 Tax=Heyndrickxia acidiproducens TaxID=1121084 RepID=UPI00035E17DC|nr:YlbG family protein [Heyndrickxia acidiproducens]
MLSDRQGLIIWLYQLKHNKFLRRFGNIHYVSKKMKYVVLYCDRSDVQMIQGKIENLPFVRKVDRSMKPFLKTEYENARPDKAKEYDYKIGL